MQSFKSAFLFQMREVGILVFISPQALSKGHNTVPLKNVRKYSNE